jgi:O-antigen/teichoic acid export membrane protein
MGVVYKQSVISTVVTFIGAAIGGVSIFTSSALFPTQELGFSRHLTSQVVVASFLVLMGMSNTLYLYFHRWNEDTEVEKRNVFMSICFISPFIFFLIFLSGYLVLKEQILGLFQEQDIPFMRAYFMCFPLYTLFYMYISLMEHFCIAKMKIAASSIFKEFVIKGLNLAIILLYGYRIIEFSTFIYGVVLINLIGLLCYIGYAAQFKEFRFSLQLHLLGKEKLKELFTFSGYHALMSATFSLLGFLDVMFLASLDKNGLNAIPVYTNAVFIASVMSIPYRSMVSSASANWNQLYTQNNQSAILTNYTRSGVNIFIASGFMFLIIYANLHNAVALMGPHFSPMILLTTILMLGKLVESACGINDTAINMSPFYRKNFYISLGLILLLIILLYILIPKFGIYGASIAVAISVSAFNLSKTWLVWKKMHLKPFTTGNIKIICILALLILTHQFIPQMGNAYWDTAIRSILLSVLYLTFILLTRPTEDVITFALKIKTKLGI